MWRKHIRSAEQPFFWPSFVFLQPVYQSYDSNIFISKPEAWNIDTIYFACTDCQTNRNHGLQNHQHRLKMTFLAETRASRNVSACADCNTVIKESIIRFFLQEVQAKTKQALQVHTTWEPSIRDLGFSACPHLGEHSVDHAEHAEFVKCYTINSMSKITHTPLLTITHNELKKKPLNSTMWRFNPCLIRLSSCLFQFFMWHI